MIDQNRLRRASVVLFLLSLVVLVIHLESLIGFNRHIFRVHGNDSSRNVQMEINSRADSTSTWLKRDFKLDDGRVVDLTGQTIDGTLRNQSQDAIKDWELQINITGDCYINQAWNGEVEIHQFVGTENEKVQRLNLQNYQLEDVAFEKFYDGDLLIRLQKGDYVIYYPNAGFSEMPIAGGSDVKIGVIFYFLDELDLSDYDLQFHFHRRFTQGITFYIFVALVVLWLLSVIIAVSGMLAYRRAVKEMELRKSGIFSMSDIYDAIYIIRLATGEMTPVSVDERIERERPKDQTAKVLLTDMVNRDAEEKYRERILAFVDTDTLAERLKTRNSVASEFVSKRYGWCELRFCAMDRVEGKPLEDVVFTVQNINEEKQEQEAAIRQIEAAVAVNTAKAAFFDNITDDLQKPLERVIKLNGQIMRESGEDSVKRCARSAHCAATRLLMLTNGLADGFAMEAGRSWPASRTYSLRRLMLDVLGIVRPMAEDGGFDLALDISESLPDRLEGDPRMLQEVLVNLAAGSLSAAEGGRVVLAAYGKATEGKIHLLFSVRVDSGRASGKLVSGVSIEVVSRLLNGMESALRNVRSPQGHSEVYFELEQRVLSDAPIGKIALEDA